jgi:hypothetical protein
MSKKSKSIRPPFWAAFLLVLPWLEIDQGLNGVHTVDLQQSEIDQLRQESPTEVGELQEASSSSENSNNPITQLWDQLKNKLGM